MPKVKKKTERGDVFWARLDPTVGSELQKTRPVVVLSINPLNKARKTVVVVPLSTSAPAIEFLNVALKGGSVARCEHIRAIDKTRLADRIGSISDTDKAKIEEGISRILGVNH
ncbi:type II toxin-antitoxin system PemK/MazF family toxin [Limnohabitans sp. Rim8]|uniref:type II toxin-antitoxin system PemK/MazF family toxin n=1 Tax=Limnohabitans sp. Rim8 TaxID=1100718 RepID=UPI0025E0EF16|nr:type II toxin-antitoxin system PemK/MazF family toxin [Limnohabitans sp. Rim8]